MYIKKIIIKNFKCFKDFSFELNKHMNILVGDNNEGKSTILEAIHLCLTGIFRGKYLRNNLTQDIFNNEIVNNYIEDVKINKNVTLPEMLIELYFEDADPILNGMENSQNKNEACISLCVKFDTRYQEEYQILKEKEEIVTLPIEYYKIDWKNSADKDITARTIPIKSILIDTSDANIRNGSDNCIARIVKDKLEEKEIIDISQAYRKIRDIFIKDSTIKSINTRLSEESHFLDNTIEIDVEMLNRNDWEKAIITKINEIPFDYIGKGEQASLKIELSLTNKRAENSGVLLIEEPENHLTYAKLNKLINDISKLGKEKQIFITTHSSFVANKLGIENLELLNNKLLTKFENLTEDTRKFFIKKPGYDTLRFLLCKKAILVEGDADELIIQKAYFDKHKKLPIEDEIEVISVGTTFLRFLELADLLKKETVVVTDNDGDIEALEKKYKNYIRLNQKKYVEICYDKETHINQGTLKKNNGNFNYDTLEPCMVRANNLKTLNKILKQDFQTEDELIKYMVNNKTECALEIFESNENINYPIYIEEAIK